MNIQDQPEDHCCFLCGTDQVEKYCKNCTKKWFCLSCDGAYHSHPKRRHHSRISALRPIRTPDVGMGPAQRQTADRKENDTETKQMAFYKGLQINPTVVPMDRSSSLAKNLLSHDKKDETKTDYSDEEQWNITQPTLKENSTESAKDKMGVNLGSWRCQYCTFENNGISRICEMCYKTNAFLLPLESSSPTYKCGSDTKSTKTFQSTNTTTESNSDLKTSQRSLYSRWSCPHCTFENFSKDVVCAMCSSPKSELSGKNKYLEKKKDNSDNYAKYLTTAENCPPKTHSFQSYHSQAASKSSLYSVSDSLTRRLSESGSLQQTNQDSTSIWYTSDEGQCSENVTRMAPIDDRPFNNTGSTYQRDTSIKEVPVHSPRNNQDTPNPDSNSNREALHDKRDQTVASHTGPTSKLDSQSTKMIHSKIESDCDVKNVQKTLVNGWSCPRCTFENPRRYSVICEICGKLDYDHLKSKTAGQSEISEEKKENSERDAPHVTEAVSAIRVSHLPDSYSGSQAMKSICEPGSDCLPRRHSESISNDWSVDRRNVPKSTLNVGNKNNCSVSTAIARCNSDPYQHNVSQRSATSVSDRLFNNPKSSDQCDNSTKEVLITHQTTPNCDNEKGHIDSCYESRFGNSEKTQCGRNQILGPGTAPRSMTFGTQSEGTTLAAKMNRSSSLDFGSATENYSHISGISSTSAINSGMPSNDKKCLNIFMSRSETDQQQPRSNQIKAEKLASSGHHAENQIQALSRDHGLLRQYSQDIKNDKWYGD